MSTTCEVCNEQPSKYKCPSCQLRYCSLACFKTHKGIHEHHSIPLDTQNSVPAAPVPSHPPPPRPATSSDSRQPEFSALQTHPLFIALLEKYPNLRSDLRRIYNATNEPPPDAPTHSHFRHRGRGSRGYRGTGRGRPNWTPERGEKNAIGMLKRARTAEQSEGVREFVKLVAMVYQGSQEEQNVGSTKGVDALMAEGI